MTNRPLNNDPKRIWQNQNSEEPIMSLQEIRAKVRKLEITRLLIMGLGTVCWAGSAVLSAVFVVRRYQQGQTIEVAFLGYWFLISIYMAYICARALFSKRLAHDTGRKTAIE